MKRIINDIKKYWRYVLMAGQIELKSEVANSRLNWLWWIIEPLCFMFIYSLVFGVFFGAKELHFNAFVYIGINMWEFFNRMLTASVKLVRNNKAIVSKVYLPKYMLIFVKMYVNAFKLGVSFLLLAGMMLVTGVELSLHILWIIPIVLTMFVFTFGICTILMHFGVYVDDLANVTKIVLRMMFYLTGVFYNVKTKVAAALGVGLATVIGVANPMACILTAARDALLYATMPAIHFVLLWLLIGLGISYLGIRLIYANENSYVKVI